MDHEIADSWEIDTLEAFDALVAPRRLELVDFFKDPGTAKQAAGYLDVPVTRLYYHINALLAHGFLQVVEETKRGGMTERLFCVSARSFRPSQQFADRYGGEGLQEVVRLAFADAEQALRRAIDSGVVSWEALDERRVSLGYHSMRLTEEHLQELVQKLNELTLDSPDDPDGIRVAGLIAVFPKADA